MKSPEHRTTLAEPSSRSSPGQQPALDGWVANPGGLGQGRPAPSYVSSPGNPTGILAHLEDGRAGLSDTFGYRMAGASWGLVTGGTGRHHEALRFAPVPDPSMDSNAPKVLKRLTLNAGALKRLSELHRNWRLGRAQGQRLMLAECQLAGLDLSLMDFTDAYLVRCNLDRANLRGTIFRGAILTGSVFDEADLTGANFERADMRGAVFHGTDLTRSSLAAADLRQNPETESGWEEAEACRFRGAKLAQTVFKDAKLVSVDFSGSYMLETDFSGADLRKSNFAAADLQAIRLTNTELEGADFALAVVDQLTRDQVRAAQLPVGSAPRISADEMKERLGQHARWVDSLGRAGRRLELEGFDLSGLDLSRTNLAAARLVGCRLARTKLKRAWMLATDLQGANLTEADISEADLRGANLSDAHQRGLEIDGVKTGEIPGLGLQTKGLRK